MVVLVFLLPPALDELRNREKAGPGCRSDARGWSTLPKSSSTLSIMIIILSTMILTELPKVGVNY